jgi:polysaccharide biosynthesis protein PelD
VLPPVGAFVELALVMGLIYLVCSLIPGVEIATLEPSPFWVPVLLLSLQYGTVAGLLAAAVATLAYTFNGLPEQAIGENLFTFLLRIWALPILWIGVALVLGQFRLRQIEVKQSLKQKLGSRTLEAESLASYASALEERCHGLERKLTSMGPASGAAALDCLVAFTDSSVDLPQALADLHEHAFPESRLTVFALSPAAFDVIAVAAGDGVVPGPIPAHHPLYRAVVSERRALSVLRAEDEAALAGIAHAAQPILHPETRRVIGLLCFEASNPAQLSQELNARLAMIARFIAPCLSEPRIVVDNTERAVHAADTNSGRLTRGWRQLSWQKAPLPEVTEPAPASDEDVARNKSRPIVFQ